MVIRNGLAFRHFIIFISGQFRSPCPFAGISLSLYFALLYMEFFCLLLRDCLDSGCGFASVWFLALLSLSPDRGSSQLQMADPPGPDINLRNRVSLFWFFVLGLKVKFYRSYYLMLIKGQRPCKTFCDSLNGP